ncbi:MAG: phosphoglycerate mutase family protein [Alphaproteobacteria bacterium]
MNSQNNSQSKGLTIVFMHFGRPSTVHPGLSQDGRDQVTSTVDQVKEKTPINKIFTSVVTSAYQSAELAAQRLGNSEMLAPEVRSELTEDVSRFDIGLRAPKIKKLLTDRYAMPGQMNNVLFVSHEATIAGALINLTGKPLSPEEAELKFGAAAILHFDTDRWSEIGPDTFDTMELVSPELVMA